MDTLTAPVPGDGLPLVDRIRLALAHWLLNGLSPMGAIRWRWTVIRERQP